MVSFTFFVIFQWTLISIKVTASDDGLESKVQYAPLIEISPISYHTLGHLYVVKHVQDSLNLTCTVFDNSTSGTDYNISWSFPYSLSDRKKPDLHRYVSPARVSLSFIIPSLESKDEGDYSCNAQRIGNGGGDQQPLSIYVSVNVKNPPYYKGKCSDAQFGCSWSKPPTCIHQRYKCDGHEDCQMGEDESLSLCGVSPCEDKLPCKDPYMLVERCIPKHWCCDARRDPNCTTKQPLPCCPLTSTAPDGRYYYSKHDTDMAFLEATIYTVIGCAMVFMIAVTVLAIAICHVYLKQRTYQSCATQPPPQGQVCLDSLTVTYTDNPPPYSKVMAETPQSPPPPYSAYAGQEGQGCAAETRPSSEES